jgi:hypothetical protein
MVSVEVDLVFIMVLVNSVFLSYVAYNMYNNHKRSIFVTNTLKNILKMDAAVILTVVIDDYLKKNGFNGLGCLFGSTSTRTPTRSFTTGYFPTSNSDNEDEADNSNSPNNTSSPASR